MRAVIQRVSSASVTIDDKVFSEIGEGLLVLIGIEDADGEDDVQWLCAKILNMRIFPDENGVMNVSLFEKNASLLLVSQFTLHASIRKGNRPSYIKASKPDIAVPLYEKAIAEFERILGRKISTGKFGADMKVQLLNDGPVTIIADSKNKDF
jgi:D-tyrosyl-tRNA(Tyr) deacylase